MFWDGTCFRMAHNTCICFSWAVSSKVKQGVVFVGFPFNTIYDGQKRCNTKYCKHSKIRSVRKNLPQRPSFVWPWSASRRAKCINYKGHSNCSIGMIIFSVRPIGKSGKQILLYTFICTCILWIFYLIALMLLQTPIFYSTNYNHLTLRSSRLSWVEEE